MLSMTATIKRDLTLARRSPARMIAVPTFFILLVTIFPLALGPDPDLLARIAPGVLMAAALMATLVHLDRLFRDDAEDGTLDAVILSPAPLSLYTAGRIVAHWMVTGLPLLILCPIMAMILNAPLPLAESVFGVILPATLLLTLIGAAVQGLSLGSGLGGVLLAVLALPLYIPVLIFSGAALHLLSTAMDAAMPMAILWACVALATPLTPLVTAATLRMARG